MTLTQSWALWMLLEGCDLGSRRSCMPVGQDCAVDGLLVTSEISKAAEQLKHP